MTDPTEAEVEAAAEALIKSAGALHWSERADDSEWYRDHYFATARAALTAAAQVRADAAPVRHAGGYTQKADRVEISNTVYGVQAPTEPAEASRDHPDIDVQCKCGWRGKQSELNWAATRSVTYFCPRCHNKFTSRPPAEQSITSPDGTVFTYREPEFGEKKDTP